MYYNGVKIFPDTVRAGDSVDLDVVLGDYPASTYALSMAATLDAATSEQITATADESGDDYAWDIEPAATAAWTAGTWSVVVYVTKTGLRTTLAEGTLVVLPDLAAASSGLDTRSHAQKTLDAIEAVIEARASQDQQSYSIAGRSLARTPLADLLALRSHYRRLVAQEIAAEATSQGRKQSNLVRVHLTEV